MTTRRRFTTSEEWLLLKSRILHWDNWMKRDALSTFASKKVSEELIDDTLDSFLSDDD